MHFNPSDVQSLGIGLSAFLATLTTIFIFLSAYEERLGRAMGIMMAAVSLWSWFGFLYHIVPGLELARELRVVSVIGIVLLSMACANFALTYFEERIAVSKVGRMAWYFFLGCGTLLILVLVGDLFGGRLVVGDLLSPPSEVLAPNAGPLLAVIIAYFALSIATLAVLLALRARSATDPVDRRTVETIFVCLPLALVLGGTRFAPWYGFDFQPLLGASAVPLFVFSAFYSIKRYNLLNVQVFVAQILIFAIWTFTFFRMILEPSLAAAIPDIGLFVAVFVLGLYLLRSVIVEIRTQKELAALMMERVKSEFVTIAAHQLRTPLTAVRWTFNLLASKDAANPLPKEQHDLIQRGSSATENMVLIVNDLLNVARITGGSLSFVMEPGDLRDVVRSSLVLFEDTVKNKNVRLTLEVPPSAVPATFDHYKLALAIQNFVDNAIRYTPSGGSVTVRLGSENGVIRISVKDTGIGIALADHARLFEKFFRGKAAMLSSPDGSGLGLFIAKSIVEGHDGSVAITSEEGHGTEVMITLPSSRT